MSKNPENGWILFDGKIWELIDEEDYDDIVLDYRSGHFSGEYGEETIKIFNSYASSKQIFIIDGCHAGGVIKPSQLLRKGRIILASSAANEYSYASSRLGMGVFTYYLIQGLEGKADGYPTPEGSIRDGWVSAEEAFYYAAPLTTQYRSDQHPQIYDGIEGQVPLVKVK